MNKKIDLSIKRRTFVEKAVKGIDSKKRTIRAYASTNAWDRYGERFEANAFKDGIIEFMKNPVILFAHESWQAPIGKAVDWEFDSKGLILTMEFAETPEADKIFKLYEGGFMNAFSVGFRPREVRWEERAPGVEGLVFVKAELLENSAVPVPANPEALVIKGFGGKSETIEAGFFDKLFGHRRDNEEVAEEPKEEPKEEPANEPKDAPAADPAPAAADPSQVEAPAAEAPKSLKEAVGYLIQLAKAAREQGKVEDEAVRSLLIQAVNLCRELVLGPGAKSLDGVDSQDEDVLSEEQEALLKEYELMTDKLLISGKATQKDIDELKALGVFIKDQVIGKK